MRGEGNLRIFTHILWEHVFIFFMKMRSSLLSNISPPSPACYLSHKSSSLSFLQKLHRRLCLCRPAAPVCGIRVFSPQRDENIWFCGFVMNSEESGCATWRRSEAAPHHTHTHAEECGDCLETEPLNEPVASLRGAAARREACR